MKYTPKYIFHFTNTTTVNVGISRPLSSSRDDDWIKFCKDGDFQYLSQGVKLNVHGFDINETIAKLKLEEFKSAKSFQDINDLNANNTLIVASCNLNDYFYYPKAYEDFILAANRNYITPYSYNDYIVKSIIE